MANSAGVVSGSLKCTLDDWVIGQRRKLRSSCHIRQGQQIICIKVIRYSICALSAWYMIYGLEYEIAALIDVWIPMYAVFRCPTSKMASRTPVLAIQVISR